MSEFPKIFRLRQSFGGPRVADVEAEVSQELQRLRLERTIKPGQTAAVTVGSRGIANIALITKAIVAHLQSLGALPFIVPAMGSHGGGTAEGQRRLIESYGVTEQFCGCPIRASMDTVIVAQMPQGFPVHIDRFAHAADHIIICARIKPHTDYSGEIESGLMKMLLIGLGKHEGAKVYHHAIQDYGFESIVSSAAPKVMQHCRVTAGVAIVENGDDETAQIAAVAPEDFYEHEKQLLKLARRLLPGLPFPHVDLLIIDEIGKDVSGTGMDTNVIGRKFHSHKAAENEFPKVKRIFVRGLTAATHGNAAGIGLAEFCTTRALAQVNIEATRINCLTSGHIAAGMLPMDYATDREVLQTALRTIGLVPPQDAKLLWIRNTLHVAEVECSAAYLAEARTRSNVKILSDLREMPLDEQGNLPAGMT